MTNTPPFDRLTRPQRIAMISVLSGDTSRRTAYLADVTDRSVRSWRKLPVFQEALADAQRDFFSACRSHFNSALAVAFRTLVEVAGGTSNEGDRLKAALSLIDRVAHTEMSAKPLLESRKANDINHLDSKLPGPNRTLAEISDAERKPPAATRTSTDVNGSSAAPNRLP